MAESDDNTPRGTKGQQRCVKTRWRDAEVRQKGIHVRPVILEGDGNELKGDRQA